MQINVVLYGKTTAAPFPRSWRLARVFLFASKSLGITSMAEARFGS